jgi:hypothetical protein
MLINKKEYNSSLFVSKFHETYFNLNIYPILNELETIAGLMSDLAEMYNEIKLNANYTVIANETKEFIIDNLHNFDNGTPSSKRIIYYEKFAISDFIDSTFSISDENEFLNNKYPRKVNFLDKVLYINEDYSLFLKHFYYYFENNKFCYSNLICYCMIIKNGGELLEEVLVSNLPFFDRWCILDTGSTDGSQDIIQRVLKNKKGKLYNEPFVDFKVSRNRCLQLAGYTCKFICMLDDTYVIKGNLKSFLDEVRGDQFSDTFSLMIKSNDTEYYSNRIIKSLTNLKYIHTIHEVISDKNNVNVTVPIEQAFIFDHRSDYMENRTNNRKQFDLELLFKEFENDPDDPRALYYIAQTYGCIGDEKSKAEYFEKRIAHPVQGYVQEKIDACFELARTYNFKINEETKEPLTDLSEKRWKRCEELYLQAYNLDKNRPDSLYFIGIHYYLNGDYQTAYYYFKLGFEVGYPIGSQYSLKPTLSFHFLPKFLTEVCYFFEDYQTGFAAAQFFLTNNQANCDSWMLMINWNNIYNKLLNMGPIAQIPNKRDNILCIVADGGWSKWSGKDILTKGVGGSETWVIEMARNMNNVTVIVFCNCEEPEMFENVGYNPISLFPTFIANNFVDTVIISRYLEYVPVALKGHTKSVGIIFHDLLSPEMIIPKHNKIKWLFGLTDWHSELIKNTFPSFNVKTLNYGIKSKNNDFGKIKNSFIYSSFANRGLSVLLKMWVRIIKQFPDSTLNIYCDLENKWVNDTAPNEINQIKKLLLNKKGITLHGWVSKETLSKAWETAEYWLYPCIFQETYCLTAMEAAINKTFAVSNRLAGLAETIKAGLIVDGDPQTSEWQETTIERLFEFMNGKPKEIQLEQNYQWANNQSWKKQAGVLYEMINENETVMLNWKDDVPPGNKQPFMDILDLLPEKSKILEVGCYVGTSIVEMLKTVKGSTATVIDQWVKYYEHDNLINVDTPTNFMDENTEKTFYKNIVGFENRIKVLKGKSSDKLIELIKLNETFNFIYIDASHKVMDVYLDATLAWKLLKIGGIIAFDDYTFNKGDLLNSPYEAIEYFKELQKENILILHTGYRIFLKKIN